MLIAVKNKISVVKLTAPPEIPVYEITLRKRGANFKPAARRAKMAAHAK
jgi:hypothetical protein